MVMTADTTTVGNALAPRKHTIVRHLSDGGGGDPWPQHGRDARKRICEYGMESHKSEVAQRLAHTRPRGYVMVAFTKL